MTRRNRLLAYVARRHCGRRNHNLLSSLLKTQEKNSHHHHHCKDLLPSGCISAAQSHSFVLIPPEEKTINACQSYKYKCKEFCFNVSANGKETKNNYNRKSYSKTNPLCHGSSRQYTENTTKTHQSTENSSFLYPPLIPVLNLFEPEGALCKLLSPEHIHHYYHQHHNELMQNSRAMLCLMQPISSHEMTTLVLATLGLDDCVDHNTCKETESVNLCNSTTNNINVECLLNDETQHDSSTCIDEKANLFSSPSANATSSSPSSSTSPVLHMQRRFISNINNSNNNNNSDESEEKKCTATDEIKSNNNNNTTEKEEGNKSEEQDVPEEATLPDVYAIITSCKLLNLVSANGEARLDWELPELKASYRDLAQHYHPDLSDGCAVSMEQINNAYALLRHMSLMQKRELASAMRFGEAYVLSRYDNDINNDNDRDDSEICSTSNNVTITQEYQGKPNSMFRKCRPMWFASHRWLHHFLPLSSKLYAVSKSTNHSIKYHTPTSPELLSDDMLALMAVGLYSTLLTLLSCVYYFYYHPEQWELVKRLFTSWMSAQTDHKWNLDGSNCSSNSNQTSHNDDVEDDINNEMECFDVNNVKETLQTSQQGKRKDKDQYYYQYFALREKSTNSTNDESLQRKRNNETHMPQHIPNTKANASNSSSSSSSSPPSCLSRQSNKASTRQTNVQGEVNRVVSDTNADVDVVTAIRMLTKACQRSWHQLTKSHR